MADSNIIVSDLAVTPGFGLNLLTWSYSDPNATGLPYLSLDAVEIHAAAVNDRASASKVVEGLASVTEKIHLIPDGSARWYWAKARNKASQYGEWFPSSATSGIAAEATSEIGATSGYVKLQGGVIIQWGEANDVVTFPIPFPNRIMSLACDLNWPGHYLNQICKVVDTANRDRFGFTPVVFNVQSDLVGSPTVSADPDWPFRWIAIGN